MPYVGQARPRPEQPVCNIRLEGKEGFDSNFALQQCPCPAGVLASPQVQEEGPPRANAPSQFNLPNFLIAPCALPVQLSLMSRLGQNTLRYPPVTLPLCIQLHPPTFP